MMTINLKKIIKYFIYFLVSLISFVVLFAVSVVILNISYSCIFSKMSYYYNSKYDFTYLYCFFLHFLYTLFFIVSVIFFYLKKTKKFIIIDISDYLGSVLGIYFFMLMLSI